MGSKCGPNEGSSERSLPGRAHAPGFGGLPRNGSIERVEGIEQEMRVDLRLQRAELGLGSQALDLARAESLNLFPDNSPEPRQFLQVLAQIAPPTFASAQKNESSIAFRKTQWNAYL